MRGVRGRTQRRNDHGAAAHQHQVGIIAQRTIEIGRIGTARDVLAGGQDEAAPLQRVSAVGAQ